MIGMFLIHLFLLHDHDPGTSVAVGSISVIKPSAQSTIEYWSFDVVGCFGDECSHYSV